ncbi:MAG: exo-alpha-sialidase, partial [Caldilineaceae bacterium]|nr:exo-alpha-sialidase [Caldilineaceae bacterium]
MMNGLRKLLLHSHLVYGLLGSDERLVYQKRTDDGRWHSLNPRESLWVKSVRVQAIALSAALGLLLYFLLIHFTAQASTLNSGVLSLYTSPTTATTIDTTEDPKAMGYPDGRKIVRDENGNLYVVYRKKFKAKYVTAYHIFVAKSLDNGHSWQILNHGRPIEDVGDQNQRVPAIAIDRWGTIHVVWYGKDGADFKNSDNQIKYARSTDHGESWSPWRNIAHVAGYAGQAMWQEHPAIYAAVNDQLYIVWEGYDAQFPTKTQIKLLRSTDYGESWSTWQNVAPSAVDHSRPTIVADENGKLYILAYAQISGRQQIVYSRAIDGGHQWSNWARVAPSLMAQRHVSAAIDYSGTLHVVWQQQVFSLFALLPRLKAQLPTAIYYATFDGRTWGNAVRIQAGNGGAQTFPSINVGLVAATDRSTEQQALNRLIWIVWAELNRGATPDPNASPESTIYAVAKRDEHWSAPFVVATNGEQSYPSLARTRNQLDGYPTGTNAAGATGDIVWLDHSQGDSRIHFAQLSMIDSAIAGPAMAVARSVGLQSIQPQQKAVMSMNMMSIGEQANSWLQQILGILP